MGAIESWLDLLELSERPPRLIDVACDGPRRPMAHRIVEADDESALPELLLRRLAMPRASPTDGHWLPSGEHAAELIETLVGLGHACEPEAQAAPAVSPHADPDPDPAPAPAPAPAPEASAAQLQSLAEELVALREELARATDAQAAAIARADEVARERDTLRNVREDLLRQVANVRQRRRDVEAELAAVSDRLADAEARASASARSELSLDRLDQLARAAASVAAREPASAEDLFVVERLHGAVPEDERVSQSLGVLLSRLGRHEAARDLLANLERGQLSRRAALALLRSSLAIGVLPEDARELVRGIRPSADDVRDLADLTTGLASGRVVELTEELLAVVPDEEMSAWLATVAARLTGRPLVAVLRRWAGIEPDRALHALVAALSDERLTMNDADGAALALELDWLGLSETAARDLAQRLADSLARARDAARLERLLRKADHLAPADRHRIGTEIVHAIAEITPDREPINSAVAASVRYVEDHRQSNRLAEAHRLAGFVRQNLHRVDENTQAYAELVLSDLDRALANSAIGQRVADEMERETHGDIRRAVAGRRFLLVGGQRQAWYDDLRSELGFSADSEWRESNRAEPPSMHQLKDIVRSGKLDGVFLFTDFMAHKTSAIKDTARLAGVPCVEAKMSHAGMIEAFRTWAKRRGS